MSKYYKAGCIRLLIIFAVFLGSFFADIQSMAYISPLAEENDFISFTDILNLHREKNSQLAALINKNNSNVAGIKTNKNSFDSLSAASILEKTNNIRVIFFGDSMVETMGDFTHLKYLLSKLEINGSVSISNFGVGAQNIVDALPRLEQILNSEDIDSSTIFVLGSFAYNPLAGGDAAPDQYYQYLAQAIQLIASSKAKPYLLLSLAPNTNVFGLGPKGTNWDYSRRLEQVMIINKYINKARSVAAVNNTPLIDSYRGSIDKTGEGLLVYINKDDGIHPSPKGIIFVSEVIADCLEDDIIQYAK